MKAIAVVIALGACGSSQPVARPDPVAQKPGAPSCRAVADRMTILRSQQEPDPTKAELREFAVLVKERCAIDQWSDEARECYGTAETGAAAEGCAKTLTAEQNGTIKTMIDTKRTAAAAELAAMLQKMEEFAEQSCRCKAGDTECAKTVSDDMSRWGEAQASKPGASTIDPRADPRFDVAIKKLSDCITKAMTPVEPPAPPPKAGGKKKPADK